MNRQQKEALVSQKLTGLFLLHLTKRIDKIHSREDVFRIACDLIDSLKSIHDNDEVKIQLAVGLMEVWDEGTE